MSYCLICGTETIREVDWTSMFTFESPSPLCETCKESFHILHGNRCTICSREWKESLCPDCKRWERHPQWKGVLKQNVSLFAYNQPLQKAIARWKYRGDYVLIEAFEKEWKKLFNQTFVQYNLTLVPIPLSEERLLERKFNQAEALINLLAQPSKKLLKRMNTEKQSKKTREQRMNIKNPFQLVKPIQHSVLLVDDIYTTGSTIRHAAKLLKDAGCPSVHAMTLAR
ncbi:ComF family protein [Radiobacillus deserti]|uniref:ComF family protein n=1 Tax=Radiobacillus deserti TaxID=2594883 RepID=A0A516KIV5_9BACI|nr:ComF family protein [Radiobacillus deserti]QDP41286.1 ComF family protein [Radiobacillus deserti]